MRKPLISGRDGAFALARDAVIWLAENPSDVAALLRASGLDAGALRAGARDPAFLGGVLDFLLSDEDRARRFAEAAALGPDDLRRARAALPGAAVDDWA